MFKRTKEKSEIILKLFEEGVTLTEISKGASSSQFTVKKVLASLGIDYDAYVKKDYEGRLARVVPLYLEGKPQSFIEKELNLTRKTIRSILKSTPDLPYKTMSDQWLIRYGGTLNEACFDELTTEAAYWVGLLYADGNISGSREYSVNLTLHTNDIEHLERFKIFLGSSRPITNGNGNCHRVRINSQIIHAKLKNLGFRHDKSYTAIPPIELKYSRDFWRGVVDGDGGVYNYASSPTVFLCGTLETIFDFIIFCSKEAAVKEKYPSKCQKAKALYQVHYYGQDAIKVATLLYKDSSVYLDRKYQKYLEILQAQN